MRWLKRLVILTSLTAAGPLCDVIAQETQDAATSPATAAQSGGPPAKQDARQPAKPAATFSPSEKISADSAVSFPVDI